MRSSLLLLQKTCFWVDQQSQRGSQWAVFPSWKQHDFSIVKHRGRAAGASSCSLAVWIHAPSLLVSKRRLARLVRSEWGLRIWKWSNESSSRWWVPRLCSTAYCSFQIASVASKDRSNAEDNFLFGDNNLDTGTSLKKTIDTTVLIQAGDKLDIFCHISQL